MSKPICPTFKTCQKHSFQGTEFECGTYSVETARKIKARTFADSDILRKTINGTNFITIIPDVLDKVRMRLEDWNGVSSFKTPQQTAGIHECRPFEAQIMKAPKIDDRFLHVFPLEKEYAICVPKFLPTYKRNMKTVKGFRNRWKDAGFNGWIIDMMVNDARRDLDKLITRGDYNSPIAKYSQFDGIAKMLTLWSKEYTPEVVKITLPTLTAGDYVHLAVGGQTNSIPFNTDNATTILDIITWLNTLLLQAANSPLYSVSSNYNDCIYVAEKMKGCGVEVMAFVNQESTMDWYSQASVCDGVAQVDVVQSSKGYRTPILDAFGTITKDNFYEWLTCVYLQLRNQLKEINELSINDIKIFISEEMALTWSVAITDLTKNFKGVDSMANNPLGIKPEIDKNLKGDEYYATWAGNIQFGTDLMSDFRTVDTNFDWDCESIKFRMKGVGGLNIIRPGEIITNIPCRPYNFQPPAPDLTYQFPCKSTCDIDKCPCEGGFMGYLEKDDGADTGRLVLKSQASNCDGATISYEVTFSAPDIPDANATYTVSTADGTLEFADINQLDGLSVNIKQTITGLASCSDVETFDGQTIDVSLL